MKLSWTNCAVCIHHYLLAAKCHLICYSFDYEVLDHVSPFFGAKILQSPFVLNRQILLTQATPTQVIGEKLHLREARPFLHYFLCAIDIPRSFSFRIYSVPIILKISVLFSYVTDSLKLFLVRSPQLRTVNYLYNLLFCRTDFLSCLAVHQEMILPKSRLLLK